MQISDLPDDIANAIIARKLDKLFLVSNKAKNNVIYDPMTKLPFHTTNFKVAEKVAHDAGNGAFACTLGDALKMQTLKYTK